MFQIYFGHVFTHLLVKEALWKFQLFSHDIAKREPFPKKIIKKSQIKDFDSSKANMIFKNN